MLTKCRKDLYCRLEGGIRCATHDADAVLMMTNGRGAEKADGRGAGDVTATARASGDGDDN